MFDLFKTSVAFLGVAERNFLPFSKILRGKTKPLSETIAKSVLERERERERKREGERET